MLRNLDLYLYGLVIFKFRKQKECFPELIEISDDGVKVSLQSLLNHTALRFMKLLNFNLNNSKNCIMISKWGCDDTTMGSV